MEKYEDSEIDQFKLIVEQLELCKKLFKAQSKSKVRFAIILLDNAAETMMYRICREQFSWDEFLGRVFPVRFSIKDRNKVFRYFDEKVDLLKKEKVIPEADAVVLSIAHKYRNEMFHRDTHNTATISTIARLLFHSVAKLFLRTHAGLKGKIYAQGIGPSKWWHTRGVTRNFFEYPTVAETIYRSLTQQEKLSLPSVRRVLKNDLARRLNYLHHLFEDVFFLKTARQINSLMKRYKFMEEKQNVVEDLMRELRSLNHKIGVEKRTDVDRDYYFLVERNTKLNIEKEMRIFKTSPASSVMNKARLSQLRIQRSKTLAGVLKIYHVADTAVRSLERGAFHAHEDYESAIQLEVDRRRGK